MKLKLLVWILAFFTTTAAFAQPADTTRTLPAGAPVMLYNDTLFMLYNPVGSFSKQERARAVSERIKKLAENRFFRADSVRVVEHPFSTDVVYGETVLTSVTAPDTILTGKSQKQLAGIYAERIKQVVRESAEQNSLRSILIEIGMAIIVLLVFFLLFRYVNKLFRYFFLKIRQQENVKLKGLRVKDYELLTPEREVGFILALAKVVRVLVLFLLLYFLLPVLFSIFPWTEGYADTLLSYILNPLRKIFGGIISYIPNLLAIAVIVMVTHYVVRGIAFLAGEIEAGKLEISGFYTDWARPTLNIVRFLLYAFMFVVIWPYLPGSDSDIFKGVSVFLGILFSLGSSSAIANMVAGLVLTYMRSFKIGDRIKIGDVSGDVVEKTLLVTRVRTTKNEDITIPNAMILTSHTTNYTTCCERERGIILHTTVTIGYDVPWPKVQQALIDAALATDLVLKDPAPFVLQTSLDDFYVSYQLNAYTLTAHKMAVTYSCIHQNIQDKFNEAGIEILSPHYRAQRDGNATTIPAYYLPQDYQAPPFRVEQVQK